MNDFERIISDSMIDEVGREWIVEDATGWDDEEWLDVDDYYPEDFQGEEEFA